MSKYYIPKIEEFHIGFEYEQILQPYIEEDISTHKYTKLTYSGNINSISNFGLFKEIRVKHLDGEDIKSLKFKQISDDCYNLSVKEFRGRLNQEVRILVRDTIMIYLALELGEAVPKVLFTGYIKNKSEFKKILTQINIK